MHGEYLELEELHVTITVCLPRGVKLPHFFSLISYFCRNDQDNEDYGEELFQPLCLAY